MIEIWEAVEQIINTEVGYAGLLTNSDTGILGRGPKRRSED
jgi:hypothetical protein